MVQARGQGARLSRRVVLRAGATALVTSPFLAGCDFSTEPEGDDNQPSGTQQQGKEAPMLAERVDSGELPRVAERLPANPLVVKPNDRAGVYGGTWRAAMLGPTDTPWLDRSVGYEMLLRWRPDTIAHELEEIVPNIAESYETNRTGTEYTFHLRAGMKWSDGQPFTADDILFAVNDVYLNEELYPVPPLGIVSGTTAAKVTKLDAQTVRFTFTKPSSLFPHLLASKNSGLLDLAAHPRHYLTQFHADHNPDIAAEVKKAGMPNWVELFLGKVDAWNNPELPTLKAWVTTTSLSEGTNVAFERNPYYWKVDSDGRQLPYLDHCVSALISEPEAMLLKATNGEIDMYDRLINTFQNKPVLASNRDDGDYHFVELRSATMNTAIIQLNLTHKDPVRREVFQNKDFRVGLSHAINREEIIQAIYQRQGEPWQVAPLPDSPYFDEQFATQYTEYNVDLANSHLDRAGYSARDDRGRRLGPDGSPISFAIEIATRDYGWEWASLMELVRGYWKEVGVEVNVKPEDSSLLTQRNEANLLDATVWVGDIGGLDPHLDPRYLFPSNAASPYYAGTWAQWYRSGGTSGEQPPDAAQQQMDLYDEFRSTVDRAEQDRLMQQIVQIAREQFYIIGISRPTGRYGIVRNDFHNVPEPYLEGSNYPNPGPTNPEQYFTTKQ